MAIKTTEDITSNKADKRQIGTSLEMFVTFRDLEFTLMVVKGVTEMGGDYSFALRRLIW